MNLRLLGLVGLIYISLVYAEQVKYTGYKVIRITPKNEKEVEVLRDLESLGLSFWTGPNPPNRSSDVLFPPHMFDVIDTVRGAGLEVSEYISDVQSVIDETSIVGKSINKRNGINEFRFDIYHRLDEILDWLDELEKLHPDLASTFSIGKSYEGRDLRILKIAKPSGTQKRAIWIDASIHAREWITGGVTLFIINELLNGNNPIYQGWIEDYDWYFLPVHNPDGFEYSHTNNRLWRKTRSNAPSSTCKGADPNRNWDYYWRTGGSSTNPCSETYAGPKAFSEPETNLTAQFINTIADQLDFFVSLHSYSQLILISYGVRVPFPPHDVYMKIGTEAATAIAKRYGTRFVPGNIVDLLYVASGGSMDWVKGIHDVPLAYTFELRDRGSYGFLLPPNQIQPSSLELLDGLAVMIDAVRKGIPPTVQS